MDEEEKLLRIYLKEISKYPLLTPEEEKELAKKAKEGDRNSLKKLIESNLKLVVHFALKFKTPGVSIIDLINQGNLALVKAAKKFDPDKDTRFSTYAKWWVRNALWEVLTQKYPFSLSPQSLLNLVQVEKYVEKLKMELGRVPTFEELKKEYNEENKNLKKKISVNELRDLYEFTKNSISLSDKIGEDENLTVEDIIKAKDVVNPEAELIRQSLKKELNSMLNKLSEIEKSVIEMRFGLGNNERPMSITEVSKVLGYSRERIRQIEKKALNKLRKFSQYKRLESFLN